MDFENVNQNHEWNKIEEPKTYLSLKNYFHEK